MLAKVKGVQWCSNAAKLHDNELSSSFSPLRIKEKYHLHEDKRNRSRVIVPSEAVQLDRNKCTATITCCFNIINVFLLFFRGWTYIWATHSWKICFWSWLTKIPKLVVAMITLEKVSIHHLPWSIPQGILRARRLPAPVLYQRMNAFILMLPHIID